MKELNIFYFCFREAPGEYMHCTIRQLFGTVNVLNFPGGQNFTAVVDVQYLGTIVDFTTFEYWKKLYL